MASPIGNVGGGGGVPGQGAPGPSIPGTPAPPGQGSVTRLVDKDHYPWADPTSVPKVPIVPTLFAGLLPQVPEKGMFDVQALGESCLFRTAMSLVGGVVLGGAFGVLAGAYEAITPPVHLPGQPAPPTVPFKQAMKDSVVKMRTKSKYWMRNFAIVGGVYTFVECNIENLTASHSMKHSVAAGCVTGAALAVKSGPAAMCLGCVGFGIFSAVIDKVFDN